MMGGQLAFDLLGALALQVEAAPSLRLPLPPGHLMAEQKIACLYRGRRYPALVFRAAGVRPDRSCGTGQDPAGTERDSLRICGNRRPLK